MPVIIGRRELIAALGGAVAWPLAVHAQQPAKVPRVGILSPAASETAPTLTAVREGLRNLGYIGGQTIALDLGLSRGIMEPTLAFFPNQRHLALRFRR
jgi:putative ABC transport system substrate-binding protein